MPARRAEQIRLRVDNEGIGLRADGSDFVTVVAEITDKNGNVKRLNNYYIKFFVEGEGRILGGANVLANPAPVKWGSATSSPTMRTSLARICSLILCCHRTELDDPTLEFRYCSKSEIKSSVSSFTLR